jgi:hypothetical protein
MHQEEGRMKRTRYVLILAIMMVYRSAGAADAYFVRFQAPGRFDVGDTVLWADEILFYNTGTAPAIVRFLGVSNGTPQPDPPTLTLPPGQVISLDTAQSVNERWLPLPVPTLWVLHLDVPAGVVAESRNEYSIQFAIPELFPFPRGKVSMPIFRELAPAGKPQVHLGTDLSVNDSRLNVMIYNGGGETATATIEVRRTCDSALMDSRTITVTPNTLVQAGSLAVGPSANCPPRTTEAWARYTIVTVSQPSLTFVSNLNESLPEPGQFEFGLVPIVGLGITKNEAF